MINISVPFTEMVMTCDALEFQLERHQKTKIETLINRMFKIGYNMDVFDSDYNTQTNLRETNETKNWSGSEDWVCMSCEHFTILAQNYCANCGKTKGTELE